jgi:hypothetical protein
VQDDEKQAADARQGQSQEKQTKDFAGADDRIAPGPILQLWHQMPLVFATIQPA